MSVSGDLFLRPDMHRLLEDKISDCTRLTDRIQELQKDYDYVIAENKKLEERCTKLLAESMNFADMYLKLCERIKKLEHAEGSEHGNND